MTRTPYFVALLLLLSLSLSARSQEASRDVDAAQGDAEASIPTPAQAGDDASTGAPQDGSQAGKSGAKPNVFLPTERISEDYSVAFPSDI